MDVYATRLENLHRLVHRMQERNPELRKKHIALQLDMSPSFLSQLLGGKRMGDDVARKIELAAKLPHGAMDHPIGLDVDATPPTAVLIDGRSKRLSAWQIDPDTISAALQLVRLSFLNLGLEIDQEQNGEPLAAAYAFLMERREQAVTANNLIEFKPRLMKMLKEGEQANVGTAGDRATGTAGRR